MVYLCNYSASELFFNHLPHVSWKIVKDRLMTKIDFRKEWPTACRWFMHYLLSKKPGIEGLALCVETLGTSKSMYSTPHPYALGVNFITVWSGTSCQGNSFSGISRKYPSRHLKDSGDQLFDKIWACKLSCRSWHLFQLFASKTMTIGAGDWLLDNFDKWESDYRG